MVGREGEVASRLAALVAAVFAAAVIAPPAGVVIHRHTGGDHAHVHADLAGHPHHDGHAHDAGHHHEAARTAHHHADVARDAHEHAVDRPIVAAPDDRRPGTGPEFGPGGEGAHLHTLPHFDQAVAAAPPGPAPPRPLARLARTRAPVRIPLTPPATRSRAPPLRSI